MNNLIKSLLFSMLKKKIIKLLTKAAKRTDNKVDDMLVNAVIRALNNTDHGLVREGADKADGDTAKAARENLIKK